MTRDELITCGMPLVRKCAHAFARGKRNFVAVDDLIGAGHLGLLEAVRRYDAAACSSFEGYAVERIYGAMRDWLRSDDWLSPYARTRVTRIERALHALQHELGRDATEPEIRARAQLPTCARRRGLTVAQYQQASVRPVQLNLDALPIEGPAPDARLLALEELRELRQAVDKLSVKHQQVLELWYRHERSQVDIGRELGVTESRVCQMLREASERLRVMLEGNSALVRESLERRRRRAGRDRVRRASARKLAEAAE